MCKGKIIGTEVAAIKPSHQARPELLVQVVNLPLHLEIWENVADVGALVGGRFSGQGYITEAVRGITHFAFETLGARRMEIRCDARNVRSIAVAERSGFALEATLHKHMVAPDGALRDTLIFSHLEPVGLPGTGIVDKDD